jgi:16S rRNA (cytosine967-C5)-methyltransferase
MSSSSDAPRLAAMEMFRAVRDDQAYANLLMPSLLEKFGLDGRDAAFATELAYGSMRMQGLYDAILARCSKRAMADIEPEVHDALILGTHQLLSMRVPDHAAVDTSCALVRAVGAHARADLRAGFVNAVLRCVAQRDLDEWLIELGIDNATTDAQLAVRYSHPEWIVSAMRAARGERGEVAALLSADNEAARPALAVLEGDRNEVLDQPGVSIGQWSECAVIVDSGVPGLVPAVRAGRAIVQDEGSQLVTQALMLVPVPGPESAWLDMCAGPGGKARLLYSRRPSRSIHLTACEMHPHRAELVREALLRGNPESGTFEVVVGDARTRPWGNRTFDRILVDAPCTGLGALRRRPEARWRKSNDDVTELASLQRGLLNAAIDSLRKEGVVAYVTCSPHLRETVHIVDDIVMRRDDIELIDARPYLPGVPDLGAGPTVQLWPDVHGTDAMFLALIRRV